MREKGKKDTITVKIQGEFVSVIDFADFLPLKSMDNLTFYILGFGK